MNLNEVPSWGRGEILSLTGLRALAAWWVVLFHFKDFLLLGGTFNRVISSGALAVDLFFVMSGFVIGTRYNKLFSSVMTSKTYMWFIGIRLARIYPLHIVLLCFYVLVPLALAVTDRNGLPDRFSFTYFVQSVFLIQDWGLSGALAWNMPAWSISAELLFYLMFPLITFVASRLLHTRFGLLAVGFILLLAINILGDVAGGLTEDIVQFGALRCLVECMLGIWLSYAATRMAFAAAGSVGLLALSTGLIVLWWSKRLPDYAALPPAFVFLIWGLLDGRNVISRALAMPVLVWLGEISFSTYLVHFFCKDWVKFLLGDRMPALALSAVYVLSVLLASIALNRQIEVPGRRAGRRLANRLRAPLIMASGT